MRSDSLRSSTDFASPVDERAVLSFPPFRLDLAEERLWKGEREMQLRRKPFAILRYLAQRPRRLVTHGEIVEAVWGSAVAMSESLLRTHMRDLRRALGEALIETVFGRGYRFMAAVNGGDRESPGNLSDAMRSAGWARGRHLELATPATPASVYPIGTITRSQSDLQGRILEQLADAIAASGLTASVVLVVGGPPSLSDHPAGRDP